MSSKMSRPMSGVPVALKMEIQRAMKLGRDRHLCEILMIEKINKSCRVLRNEFRHLKDVKRLFFYVSELGVDLVAEIAGKKLSGFLFRQEADKIILKRRK